MVFSNIILFHVGFVAFLRTMFLSWFIMLYLNNITQNYCIVKAGRNYGIIMAIIKYITVKSWF